MSNTTSRTAAAVRCRIGLAFTDGLSITLGAASDGHSLQVGTVLLIDQDGLSVGLRIETDAGKVYVYNWGDELFVEPELPDVVRAALVSD